VAAEFMELTFRIVGQTLLSVDLGGATDRFKPAITTVLDYVQYRLDNFLAPGLVFPTPRNLRFGAAIRTIDRLAYEIIADRRRAPAQHTGDLLALLMAVRDDESGEGLTDRELRDQVMTFIVAGQETTAVALTWTFYLLARHPQAAARLESELAEVLGGRVPQASDLPRLAYTRRAIEESLRIFPPVWGVVRDARVADEIGGYHIPARSMVVLSPYITHRHPAFWPEPERFDPDRFLPERVAERPKFAWFPFLGGPHQCIGQEFAIMELTLVVAMVAQWFRLELSPDYRLEVKPMLSLRPRGPLWMSLRRRESISVANAHPAQPEPLLDECSRSA
jgi:cytochrome P450